jgi:hypothetical protein
MAFMVPILAHRVAEPSPSGYSAPPNRVDHAAYGNKHMLYS